MCGKQVGVFFLVGDSMLSQLRGWRMCHKAKKDSVKPIFYLNLGKKIMGPPFHTLTMNPMRQFLKPEYQDLGS